MSPAARDVTHRRASAATGLGLSLASVCPPAVPAAAASLLAAPAAVAAPLCVPAAAADLGPHATGGRANAVSPAAIPAVSKVRRVFTSKAETPVSAPCCRREFTAAASAPVAVKHASASVVCQVFMYSEGVSPGVFVSSALAGNVLIVSLRPPRVAVAAMPYHAAAATTTSTTTPPVATTPTTTPAAVTPARGSPAGKSPPVVAAFFANGAAISHAVTCLKLYFAATGTDIRLP